MARCADCGHVEPKWLGQCPGCGAWGTMTEQRAEGGAGPGSATAPAAPMGRGVEARPIPEVSGDERDRDRTGIGELDRVLGGGLVAGSVTLVGGEPGAGKSTLLLQAADALARAGRTVLYATAEESQSQVRLRAGRLGTLDAGVLLAAVATTADLRELSDRYAPDVLIVDSVQTVRDEETGGVAGGTSQVRAVAAALVTVAKARGLTTLLVGHVTKDGSVAGPRALEHLVDAVCELGGEAQHALRLLRATKNRFGATGEVGCFEMTGQGLRGVADPSAVFGGRSEPGTTGVARTVALEGHRPLLAEVQALSAPSQLTQPRRVATGVDTTRLALLLAVLDKRAGLAVGARDVYVASVGGLALSEPAVDLAACLAVASSETEQPLPDQAVLLGEVGLAGEVRPVPRTADRLAEAARLGCELALVPTAYDGPDAGLVVRRVRTVGEALAAALRPPAGSRAAG